MRDTPYAFNNTAMVLIGQHGEYFVHKPLQAVSMSADHVRDWAIIPKLNFFPVSEALRANGQIFKTISQPRKLTPEIPAYVKQVYLIHNPAINFRTARWQQTLCWLFFTLRTSIWDQLFNHYQWTLQNDSVFLPCSIIKITKWNSRAGLFPLSLFLFDENNRGDKYRRKWWLQRQNYLPRVVKWLSESREKLWVGYN